MPKKEDKGKADRTLDDKRTLEPSKGMKTRNFKDRLRREGLSNNLVNSCWEVVEKVQKSEGIKNSPVLDDKTLKKLSQWDYTRVMSERDFENIYRRNSREIDKIYEDTSRNDNFMPSSMGKRQHTRGWSEEAKKAEEVLTREISYIVHRYNK